MNIGLLFGSFNPIHIGHLVLANYFVEYKPFAEIWFIVTPQNPFKKEENLVLPQQRLAMVSSAISSEPRFRASDVEFTLPRPSYTIDTLDILSRNHPQHRFSLIMGSDNLTSLHRWKSSEKIVNQYSIVVYPRTGHPLPEKTTLSHPHITLVEAPLLDISSTFVREGLIAGKNLRFFLPPSVYEYICTHHLYGT